MVVGTVVRVARTFFFFDETQYIQLCPVIEYNGNKKFFLLCTRAPAIVFGSLAHF